MQTILDEVLKEVKPSKQEELDVLRTIKAFIKSIQKHVPECRVILGGSGEKGTWLRKAHDADIFVLFPRSYADKTDELSDILEKKLKKHFTLTRLHGSRDYFQIKQDNETYELIPILAITKADQAWNITDISPLHAKWVKKHKKYVDDIRLTKQFFKACRAYGAESYIQGFSGYICEVLTIHYKGFSQLIRALTKWKPKTIVDVEGYFKGKDPLFELDKAKTLGPLIVVDPVQQSRNAAAAVSEERYKAAIKHAKQFLKRPSSALFFPLPIDPEQVRKKAGKDHYFHLSVRPLEGKHDVVGCKLLKVFEHMKRSFIEHEFTILYADWQWKTHAEFYFIIKKETLSKEIVMAGPPLRLKHFAEDFKKQHSETYTEGKQLFAKEKRKYLSADALMKDLLKNPYIRERVKTIT